ncbi:zinc finger MYM-type protein 1-like [Acyrthosiphon pisum]|uniref:Zinc finger MYM-type protein 1-like n=1 Tax=Acyrthosiphon pisum TaxID=7029 RepID=A0A8R1X193_ACYPI|nr:zinc finger MYM-type protein 1-like [Acyrthosiphon pisum]|eukprot:XP_008179735.1 PREDICTED: zinc finger MYM-type protein 1-like [Acyrthosiphon pisum]
MSVELSSKDEETISDFTLENKDKECDDPVDQISVESNSEEEEEEETISDFNFENNDKEYLDCQHVSQSSNIANFIRPCRSDSITIKNQFFSKHPIQPFVKSGNGKLDFKRIYFKILPNNNAIQRKWISYSSETICFYCSSCMAYGPLKKPGEFESKFITGYSANIKVNKSLYKDIERHENSKAYEESVSTAIRFSLYKDIKNIINRDVMAKSALEIETRRKVLERLIDIILFIGRQGIPYRGKQEGAHSLNNENQNHGHFLELIIIISKYDVILQQHLNTSIKHSDKNKSKKGRGSLVTFLSKHFINDKLIIPIGNAIQIAIVNEIKEYQHFSIMIDSTQDVSVMDQLTICVRYIHGGAVQERLLSLVICHDSSGKALFELLNEELKNLRLSINDIVSCSFDGASNMKGIYNGLQAHLKTNNPKIVYTHCMGHVLNLVMTENSHKRMSAWMAITQVKHVAHNKLYRLQKIGVTRWWSKDKALSSIININLVESNQNVENSKFVTFLEFLISVNEGNFNTSSKYMARSLIGNWSKFETIFIAALFIDIFSVTSPLSKYLQTKSINYLQAWAMIDTLKKQIQNKRKDAHILFLFKQCQLFTKNVNSYFLTNQLVDIEENFSERRISKKKIMPGERGQDESRSLSSYDRVKFEAFSILDVILNSIEARFMLNQGLLKDCHWLDPKTFSSINSINVFPNGDLETICELAGVERKVFCKELKQFAGQFESFHSSRHDTTITDSVFNEYNINYSEDEEKTELVECHKSYKYVLLLPSTLVTCERVFSKLKLVKSKIRSTISQQHLSPLMLMAIEKDIKIQKTQIIDTIAKSSKMLHELLI